jgi:tripartite-type tricarboxylate transporter receptor subunit TctC
MIARRAVLGHITAVVSASMLPSIRAFAQAFPAKPIHIIVPFPPGGPADTAVRIAQAEIEKALGQPVIIENVAGAAGGLGAQRVKQSEPDGYTLLQAASPHTTNTAVKPQANVDLIRDFVSIGQTGNSVYTLCAPARRAAPGMLLR